MLRLEDCVDVVDAGGKAQTLARLLVAGVPVMPGYVLLPGDSISVLPVLSGRVAVRSSSTAEDRPGKSAAGVFWSEVVDAADLAAAVARVRASADSDAARAYGVAGKPLAVLIQAEFSGEWLGVARRRSDGSTVLERRKPTEPEWGDVEVVDGGPSLSALFDQVEGIVGAPVDLELGGPDLVLLQARPSPPPPSLSAFEVPGPGHWRRDAEHNPLPLSAAQAGLVALVETLGIGASQRVVDGWLYWQRGRRRESPMPPHELRSRYDNEIAPDCQRVLAAVDETSLQSALDAYLHVYARYVGEVSPTLRKARAALDNRLQQALGEGLAAHADILAGAGGITVERDQLMWRLAAGEPVWAELVEWFGAYAPAWDVAVPTDGEDEARVRRQAAAFVGRPSPRSRQLTATATAATAAKALARRLDAKGSTSFEALLAVARDAIAVAEDDDRLFFAAQLAVRKALLHRGRALVAQGRLSSVEDVFALPLDVPPGPLDAIIAAARHLTPAPPDAFDDGVALPPAVPSGALRGHPTSGAGRGRAVVLTSTTTVVPPGAVLIVPAILPSLGHLLPSLAALVTEYGGALSHGATLAREYGIPAVLGVRGATTIPDGADVYVDGARGLVVVT